MDYLYVKIGLSAYVILMVLIEQSRNVWAQDIFCSTTQLRNFARSNEFRSQVNEYIQHERDRLDDIQRALQDPIMANPLSENDIPFGHPVWAYHFLKNLTAMTEKISDSSNEGVLWSTLNAHGITKPSPYEYLGATRALLRLQRTYDLPIEELVQGIILGRQVSPLSKSDCYEVAKQATNIGEYGLRVQWLNQSIPDCPQKHHANLLLELAEANAHIGDHESALQAMDTAVMLDPLNVTLHQLRGEYFVKNATFYQQQGAKVRMITADSWQKVTDGDYVMYELLCRSKEPESLSERVARQFCRYRKTAIPIVVVKEEVLSTDPWIALFHDIVSDAESEAIKRNAAPSLKRAQVHSRDIKTVSEFSDGRVSKVSWLWDRFDELYQRLSKRISLFTGLSTFSKEATISSAEPFQVINYGLGGQYAPHHDYFELSDVEAGGSTVFPLVGVRVPPVKNAAAFWFNLKRSGEKDKRTKHAGCPVLLGEKWVANKWIREYGQEFRRPCGLTNAAKDD